MSLKMSESCKCDMVSAASEEFNVYSKLQERIDVDSTQLAESSKYLSVR